MQAVGKIRKKNHHAGHTSKHICAINGNNVSMQKQIK